MQTVNCVFLQQKNYNNYCIPYICNVKCTINFNNRKNVTGTETVTFETVPTTRFHTHCLLSLSSQHFNAVSKETKEHWNSAVECRRVIGAEGRVV